ncbi:heat shock protein GrpE [Mesobacillus boroniphilus JCM 21738]|uniref:Heat shock protein GrpE n=1 Tax=Mesobacillus boroniphilus JCM 21738 TaxID=1294265 RepID=W4RR88_9BACI|nr:heat shock protein GrpE [Mesobacillus boroniphilus JCM 21738]
MTEERNTEQELNSQTEEETVEEVFAENEASENTEEMPAQDPLEQKVAKLEGKLEEADNRYLRLQADFDNFRRRSRIELEASAKYRAQSIISDLLPAIDNFERALKMEVDNEQAKSLNRELKWCTAACLMPLKMKALK